MVEYKHNGVVNMTLLIILIILGLLVLTSILLILASNKRKKDKINKAFEEATEAKEELKKIEEDKPNELQQLINKMQEDIDLKPEDVVKKFEDEQEEKAIISYKELVDNVRSGKVQAIDDETNKPVETYQISEPKTIDKESTVTPEMLKDAIENISINSVKEEVERFRSSEYISPVYGILKDNMSYPTIKKKEVTLDAISNTRDYTELTEEIKRQEEFLKALKEFRDSL